MNKNRTSKLGYGSRLVSLVLISSLVLTSVSSSIAAPPPPEYETFETKSLPPGAQSVPAGLIAQVRTSSHPQLDSTMASLAAAARVSTQEAINLAQSQSLRLSGKRVHVQVVTHAPGLENVIEAIGEAGGEVTGVGNDDTLIQGWLPVNVLEIIAAQDDVYLIRRPAEVVLLEDLYVGNSTTAGNSTTEGLAVINGPAWHTAGHTGAGVKVAIIDWGFLGYTSLLGTDLPASVTAKNFVDGEDDSQVDGTTGHGTASAEIIYDIAPGAALYLAKVTTNVDLAEAVAWAKDTHQVDIISTSLGWYNLTPGDGTGEFADLVQDARNAGILWVTSAGDDREAHWGGLYSDPDADDVHNFSGDQEINFFGPGDGTYYPIPEGYLIMVFLRWDDWTNVDQDYDLLLLRWDDSVGWEIVGAGVDVQDGSPGQTPTEFAYAVTDGADTAYGFAIGRYDSTRNVHFEAFAPLVAPLDEFLYARSLSNLADAPDAMTVAALDVTSPYPQEPYSSEGPTNGPGGTATGGFTKPDISGFANVSTESYGAGEFDGTSAATPHVAGAAALALSANPTYTPDQLQSFLEGRAIDMGSPGMDTLYGHGRLYLGDPPTVSEGKTWNGSVSSDWHTADNWAPTGVPTSGVNVLIPDVINDPIISSSDAAANNLTVNAGAVLDLTDRTLTVEGALTNNGTLKQTQGVAGGTTSNFLRITNLASTQTKYYGVDITPSTTFRASAEAEKLTPSVVTLSTVDTPESTAPRLAAERPESLSRLFGIQSLEGKEPSKPAAPWVPQAAVNLVLDDGTIENASGVNSETNGYQFIWLNRFTPDPGEFPFTLDEIWMLFDSFGGGANINVGDAIDLVVYEDADGDPSNGATWLATFNETVQAVDGVTWNVYALTTPVLLNGPGDVLIAAINRYIVSGVSPRAFPASFDQDSPQNRSWLGWYSTDPPDPAILPPDYSFSIHTGGNFTIRGYGSTVTSNTPPTISGLPDQTVPMNGGADNAIDLWAYADDAEDADADLTFAIVNSPTISAGVTIDSNRYIDINPAPGWTGVTDVEVQVEDTGGLTDTDTFQVTVSDIPDIEVSPTSLEETLAVDEVFTATMTISNTGTAFLSFWFDSVAVSWLSVDPGGGGVAGGGSQLVDVIFDATGQSAGDYNTNLVINSNDPDEDPVTVPVTMHVTSTVNTSPTISGLPDQIVAVNGSADNAIDLWVYAADAEDADADLTFAIVNSPTISAGVTIDSNRYIDINPVPGWSGTTDVEVQVEDTGGLTDTDSFQVTVDDIPDIEVSPTFLEETLAVDEVSTATLTISNTGTAFLSFWFDSITVSWLSVDPGGGGVAGGGSQLVDVIFDATGQSAGDYNTNLVINSNDPDEDPVTVPVTMHVTSTVNTSPTISGLPDLQVPVNGTLHVPVDLWAYAGDAEDDDPDLTFTIVNSPVISAGVSITANRYIVVNPAPDWSGVTDVEVQVEDTGGLTDTDSFQVTISDIPDIEVSPASFEETLAVGGQVTRTLTISNTGAVPLTFEISEQAGGFTPTMVALSTVENTGDTPGLTLPALTAEQLDSLLELFSAQPLEGKEPDKPDAPLADVELIIDDGTQENGLVLRDPGTSTEFHVVLFNHFDAAMVAGFPFTLERIDIHEDTNNLQGEDIQLLVYTDADGGDPSNATLLYGEIVTVQTQNGWNSYTLIVPVLISDPADVLIGFSTYYADGGVSWPGDRYPYPMDQTAPQGRSYLAWMNDTADPVDPSDLSSFPNLFKPGDLDPGLAANWLVRGYGSLGAAGDEVPWLFEDPVSGTVPAGASLSVDVLFDATGLALGDYTANLIVNSNDPDDDPVTVPVTMHVSGPPNTPPTLSGLPDRTVPMNGSADNTIDLWAYADDAEDTDDVMTYTILNSSDPSAGVTVDSNRYIDINPATGWTGVADVEIQVQDTGGLTDTDTFRVTVISDLINVTVSVSGNQFCSGRTTGVRRCFDVDPAAAMAATVRFYLSEAERNGLTLDDLLAFRYSGGNWIEEPGPYTSGGTGDAQYVEAQNVADFSLFALDKAGGGTIYLPLVVKIWPPPIPGTPVLNPITLQSYGDYVLSWNSTDRAEGYVLEEATRADFGDAQAIYQGSDTSHTVTDQSPGSYFYRVKATNNGWSSGWSNVQIIFHDNFSDPNSGWGVYENDVERWRYIGGRYEGTKKGPGLILERAIIRSDNYTLQTEVYPVSPAGDGSYGLVFGLSEDWTQFYQFMVEPSHSGYDGFYRIDKRTSAGWTELRDWTEHSVPATHCRLKVVRQGSRIEVYIDGVHVDTVYDSQLTGLRRVGVEVNAFSDASGWVTTRFDDFMLTTTAE